MAETTGGEIWLQVLQAVQALGARMDQLDAKVDKLDTTVGGLVSEVKCLRADMGILRLDVDSLRGRMDKLEVRMGQLEARMGQLEVRMDKQEARMEKQYEWLQRLGAESVGWREELRGELRLVRTEMQDGFRRVNARMDLTDSTVVLMASVLRRPTELGERLEQQLGALEVR